MLHVIPSLSMTHGGPSHAMRTMDKVLRNEGIQVDVVTTDDDGTGRYVELPLGRPLAADGVPSSGAHWYFHKNTEFYKCSWSFARWIRRHVRDYDLVHVHALFSFVSVVTARAAYHAGVPYVVRPLGTLSPYGLQQRRAFLKRCSLRWVEGPMLERAAAVHVTSEQEREDVENLGFQVRCAVIPLGLFAEVDAPDSTLLMASFPQLANQRFILFLSRLDPKKNIEALIDAFSLVAAECPDCVLAIAGAGAPGYAGQLRERAAQSAASNRVHWLGHVEGDAKAALLAGATLFVLPSFSENFGIAAAEALSAGLPCVLAKGVALAKTVASEGAGLSTGTDAQSIAAAVSAILFDGKLHQLMSQRASALALREYSASAMGVRLVALYNNFVLKKTESGGAA